jgi:hypothetical protein
MVEWPEPGKLRTTALVPVDFARQLERELAIERAKNGMLVAANRDRLLSARLTMPRMDEILLACGEMTAGEQRAVKAALGWFIRRADNTK